jgi:hypothetical protein
MPIVVKPEILTFSTGQVQAGEEADAVRAGARALDAHVAQHDPVVDAGIDDDAARSGRRQRSAGHAAAVDRDRLGDGDGTEATRIEDSRSRRRPRSC